MLVIAGNEVPNDVEALLTAFKNVPTFIACIGVLAIFWRGHWIWSRRKTSAAMKHSAPMMV